MYVRAYNEQQREKKVAWYLQLQREGRKRESLSLWNLNGTHVKIKVILKNTALLLKKLRPSLMIYSPLLLKIVFIQFRNNRLCLQVEADYPHPSDATGVLCSDRWQPPITQWSCYGLMTDVVLCIEYVSGMYVSWLRIETSKFDVRISACKWRR